MSRANRGMGFEALIDRTNQMYERQGIALINKRPTPVKILGTNSNGMIRGFVERPSTVDYDGVSGGLPIAFEAKSTMEINRFPLSKVAEHQYEYLQKCHEQGAASFLLIEFAKHQTVYLLPFPTLKHYWTGSTNGGVGRGSISLGDLDLHAYQIEQGRVPVDYMPAVDKVWRVLKWLNC